VQGLLAHYRVAVQTVGGHEFGAAVRGLAARYGVHPQDREDIVQKVAMHVLKYPGGIDLETGDYPLPKTVRQVTADEYRAKVGTGKTPHLVEAYSPDIWQGGDKSDWHSAPTDASYAAIRIKELMREGLDWTEDATMKIVLKDAFAILSDLQREVMQRTYYGGQTSPEVAAALGIPEGTVRRNVYDSVRRLRTYFARNEISR
jgi:RNA polymerase sigma factor (sigma-70 family)